jgi:hypothetical protein
LTGECGDFDFAFLDIEERVGRVALRKNDLVLVLASDTSARADSGEKHLRIEDRFGDARHRIFQTAVAQVVSSAVSGLTIFYQ